MKYASRCLTIIFLILPLSGCVKDDENPMGDDKGGSALESQSAYPGVPLSDVYEVRLIRDVGMEVQTVFQSSCPEYELGKMNMVYNDQFPLKIFKERTISWTHFSMSAVLNVEVKVVDQRKVPLVGDIRILPSRHGIIPAVDGNIIRFTLPHPGQYSVEIGSDGYKNGLLIFADPEETDIPDPASDQYALLKEATTSQIRNLSSGFSGIWFGPGVHDMGAYHVPAGIKNIYFEKGSWVYGALIMDANPDVKIFGRGVLSGAKLNYRESHSIEAIHQSNNIQVEGIVIADPKHFAVRLVGKNNTVQWTNIVGGWVYNCDGISAFKGSRVSNCFIWANDDAIKVYRDDIIWSDIVVWQLNNGGVIQMSWGGSQSSNVSLSRIDVLRAEWNKPGFNRALLSCVGNRYQDSGKYGIQQNWLIEDVVTETSIPVIFGITPDESSFNHIHNLTLKNWNVSMSMNTPYQNMIHGNDPNQPMDGFIFDNFVFNGILLNQFNWEDVMDMSIESFEAPLIR